MERMSTVEISPDRRCWILLRMDFLLGQGGTGRDAGPTAVGSVDIFDSRDPRPSEAPIGSDDMHENTNTNPCDIDKRYTKLIFDHNLIFDLEKCTETLKTVTKSGEGLDKKLTLQPYPSDSSLALLALKAYSDNPGDGLGLPSGWRLLTTARAGRLNGYFGAAFWHPDQQQVVVAHRGTKLSNLGALWTDLRSIVHNKVTSHVCSAVTFTQAIAAALHELKGEGVTFQLSITGHSLGGWLAQVTAFTVKYLQRDESTFRKRINIKDGVHAHTVVFDSPGCRPMLSKLEKKFDLRYEKTIFLKRLDITSFLSAPNRINCLNEHLGIICRVVTDLSDLNTGRGWTPGYTSKAHSMERMCKALAEKPDAFHMLDWPLRTILAGDEYDHHHKGTSCEANFHQQTDHYVFKAIDKNSCNLRIFSEEERSFLDLWEKLVKSRINLTNVFKIEGLTVENLFDEFEINIEKQIITCKSEESVKKLIRHTKALMRWIPVEVMENLATVPSAALAIFRTEEENYSRTLKRCHVDFRDTIGLEAFLASGHNVLVVRGPDSDAEMTRLANIFTQIKKTGNRSRIYTNDNHYSFMDLDGIKRLHSAVDVRGLFQSCFRDDHLFIIQSTENCNETLETVFTEISANLKKNPNNKLVIVEPHDTGFEDRLKIGNTSVLKRTDEIKLSDLTEATLEILFEQKIVILHGDQLSLREFVGEYRHLTADRLNRVSELLGPQMLKNILHLDVEMKDVIPRHDDLHVHSNLNKNVSVTRVARALRRHAGDVLLVISGIRQEEMATDRWKQLLLSMGRGSEERVFIEKDGESVFKRMCREKPDSTVCWLAASAEHVWCNSINEKGFYMTRRFHKIVFDFERFACQKKKVHKAILIFQNVMDKQFLMGQYAMSEANKNICLKSDHIKTAASDEEANDIIKRNPERPVHVFMQEANGGQVLWRRSRGSLEDIRLYVSADIGGSIGEGDLCNASNKVVIIADEPGAGKSTSLTRLSRLPQSAWAIRIDLKDFPLRDLPSELCLKSVCQFILRNGDDCLRRLLQLCLEKGCDNSRMIHIFFDGYDEIKQNSSLTKNFADAEVLRLLKYLINETAARIWVTTRLDRKEILENALSAFAVKFERISEEQQREFLVNFWRPHLLLEMDCYGDAQEEKLDKCAEYICRSTKEILGDDIQKFMGIPLQMRMLAEVCTRRVKAFVDSETDIQNIFDVKCLLDLYQQFISLKYEIYFGDKTGLNAGMSGEMKLSNVELIAEKHRMLALRTLFSDFAENNLDDSGDGWTAELCRVGLVQPGAGAEFIHRTLAEYYCADLAVDWLRKMGRYHGNAPIVELLLTDILLRDSHRVIRMFINSLVAWRPLSEDAVKFCALKTSELWQTKQHCLFNRHTRTGLHVAVLENNTEIVDILVRGCAFEPVQMIAFVAAHDFQCNTALGLATKNMFFHCHVRVKHSEHARSQMMKIVRCVEPCPYEAKLELLLAIYIKFPHVDTLNLLSRYLQEEVACLEIKKAFIRTKKILQEDIPPFLAAVQACRAGDVGELYRKMENDTERRYMLLAQTNSGETALHLAAREMHNEQLNREQNKIIRSLCNRHIAEVGRSFNWTGWTPLHCAAESGNLVTVEHLINHGLYIDSRAVLHLEESALDIAALRGNLPMVQCLVEKEADINSVDGCGKNALFSAARGGCLTLMQYLIEKGSDVNIVSINGDTILTYAAEGGRLPMVRYLTEMGLDINIVTNQGDTLLSIAAGSGSVPVVQYLVEKGLDVNILNKNGENALFSAAANGSLPVVQYLVEKGSDITISNNLGQSVLYIAAYFNNIPIVRYLVEKGSDIKNLDILGYALFTPASQGCLPMVQFLVEKGWDVNILNKRGETALFHAARTGSLPVLQYLVQQGADINILNKDGENVLFASVHFHKNHENLSLVEYLLEKMSDINVLNNNGENALFTAVRRDDLPLVQCLMEKGLDLNIVNNQGKSLLYYTAFKIQLRTMIVDFLEKKMSAYTE